VRTFFSQALFSFKKYMPLLFLNICPLLFLKEGRGGGIYFLNETSACDSSLSK
jgi:hypothetical protein